MYVHASHLRAAMECGHRFARIEQSLRVECVLHAMEALELGRRELHAHVADLLHAHSMLAGDRPADFNAELEHFGAKGLRLLGVAGSIRIVENQRMQIPVAGVKHIHAGQAEFGRQLGNALQHWRQRPAREEPIDQPGTDFSIYDQLRREGMPVHLMSPEEIIVERGFADEVKRALEELPMPMRMVVVLVDVEEFSYKEVANILGIKIGTVMSRLHRGRQALQKKLWEYSGRPKARQLAVGAR